MSSSEPRTIQEVLARLQRELQMPDVSGLAALGDSWSEIVGVQLAQHTTPLSVHDGLLTVGVDDKVWMTQLRYLETQLVEACSRFVGAGSVTKVHMVLTTGEREARRPFRK